MQYEGKEKSHLPIFVTSHLCNTKTLRFLQANRFREQLLRSNRESTKHHYDSTNVCEVCCYHLWVFIRYNRHNEVIKNL